VLDFGIAKGDSGPSGFSGTRTGAFLGTAYYMSPEQTMGQKDLDHRSDLWALGVVSFLALTGTRPFDGEAIGPLVMAITQLPVPTPSSRNPRLDSGMDAWMAKALSRAREERFQSAKEMAEAFAQTVRVRSSALPAELGPKPSAPVSAPSGAVQATSASQGGKKPYEVHLQLASKSSRTLQVTLQDEHRGATLWPWIAGGAAVVVGASIGGYFLFKPAQEPGKAPEGKLGTIYLPAGFGG
jgi:serine/threonine protein kinase